MIDAVEYKEDIQRYSGMHFQFFHIDKGLCLPDPLQISEVLKFVGILYTFIDTPILGHFHLLVLKICGYIKFVMIQNSR